jgi:hypothetical protein
MAQPEATSTPKAPFPGNDEPDTIGCKARRPHRCSCATGYRDRMRIVVGSGWLDDVVYEAVEWIDRRVGDGGVVERSFRLARAGGIVPGVLWLPPAPVSPPRLVLLGHGGSGHKRGERMVCLAAGSPNMPASRPSRSTGLTTAIEFRLRWSPWSIRLASSQRGSKSSRSDGRRLAGNSGCPRGLAASRSLAGVANRPLIADQLTTSSPAC